MVSDVTNNATLGVNASRTRVFAWSTINSAVSNLLSSTETSVDGLHTWQTTYRDASTAVTNRTDTAYVGSGLRFQTNTAPDGSYTISKYQFGRLVSATRYDSTSSQVSSFGYSYDVHGRQAAVTDARNGATTFAYNNADLVTAVTTPSPGGGQNVQTTFTYYTSRLQVGSVVAPDGATTTYEYYPSGEVKRTYGGRTYPVGYSYDYAGRVKTMTNWTSFNSGAGSRVTTWNYNANRGWLDNKRYDNNAGPDYTYSAGGRLLTRTWARIGTSSTRISTTYTYGFNDALANDEHGDLLSVTYANDPQSTPSVTYTYDRRGRTATVARNGITTTLAYNDASQLLSQTNSGGSLNSWSVANTYDPLMRRTNLQANLGSTVNASFTYGYDNASRLLTVTDGTNNGTYAYLANSPLVSQITLKSNTVTRMTLSKTYDYLNRLTQISSAPTGGSPLSFNYRYNDANQRVQVWLADGSFWLYEYDLLGQVQSGKRYWPDWTLVAGQQFEYVQDDIGNRSSTKAGGDDKGASPRVATYSVNNLNQYISRTVAGAADVIGIANAAAAVTVNNQSTYRKVEYYRKEIAIDNSSAPQWQGITNQAVQSSTTNTVTGNVFLPKTRETFFYDADGNLLSDGRWTNRGARNGVRTQFLHKLASQTRAASKSILPRSLDFLLDAVGELRRFFPRDKLLTSMVLGQRLVCLIKRPKTAVVGRASKQKINIDLRVRFPQRIEGFINTNPLPLISHPALPALTYPHVRKSRLPRARNTEDRTSPNPQSSPTFFPLCPTRFLRPHARQRSLLAHYYALPLHHVARNRTNSH